MDKIEEAIRAALVNGKLPCTQAFRIADEQQIEPLVVGQNATQLGIRITRCQLGLFGYEDLGNKRIVQEMPDVPAALARAIRSRLVGNKLSCHAAWEIACELDLPRLHVSSAVETLRIRFSSCQLGCFKG